MNSQQIEYILTVASLRSFSKAAKKLYVTQPSLSQYIMKTEQRLGFAIFDRSSNPITLTQEGEIFVEYARQFQSLEESLNNRLSDMQNLKSGTLKIGASSFHASYLLAKSIARFNELYNGVEITVTEENDARLLEMVRNGELDVIISAGSYDPALVHTEKLAIERFYLAASSESELAKRLCDYTITAEDIRTDSMRLLTTEEVSFDLLKDTSFIAADFCDFIFKNAGVTPKAALRVRSVETLFSFVNEGLGAALIPDTLIRFGSQSKHPVYFPLDAKISERTISLCSRANGYLTKAAKEYCLILKQLIDIGTWRV